MAINTRTISSVVQFAVGRDPALGASATNQDHIFERVGALGEVQIEVTNHSRTENLVLELQTSGNNQNAGYSTRQIRVAGTLGNTITVPPLQARTAIVDGPNAGSVSGGIDVQKYWRVRVSDQLRAFGTVTITLAAGELIRRNLFPTP